MDCSDHAGQSQTRLCSGALSLAGEAPSGRELLPTTRTLRLLEARVIMLSRQFLCKEVAHDGAPFKSLVHGGLFLCFPVWCCARRQVISQLLRLRPRSCAGVPGGACGGSLLLEGTAALPTHPTAPSARVPRQGTPRERGSQGTGPWRARRRWAIRRRTGPSRSYDTEAALHRHLSGPER